MAALSTGLGLGWCAGGSSEHRVRVRGGVQVAALSTGLGLGVVCRWQL